jgi:hypothetical protein
MVVAILIGAVILGTIAAVAWEFNESEHKAREEAATQTTDVPKVVQMSNEANIFLRLLRAEKVVKSEFDAAFPVSDSMRFDLAIRNTVRDLKGLEYEDVRSLVLDQWKDLGVVFTGNSRTRLLEKLHPSTQSEEPAGPELMILPIVQPMK